MLQTSIVNELHDHRLFVAPRIKIFETVRPKKRPKAVRQKSAFRVGYVLRSPWHMLRGRVQLQYTESTISRNAAKIPKVFTRAMYVTRRPFAVL